MCSTPSGTELHGDPVICPGSSAIFECKTTNTEVLIWDVNGTLLPIEGSGRVGYGITLSGNVASLVKLDLINGNGGNRTCLLFVPPANNVTMTITCGGGNPQSTCHRSITFLGKYSHTAIYFHVLRAHLNLFIVLFLFYRNRRHRKASIW